jgi:hypothetical protein
LPGRDPSATLGHPIEERHAMASLGRPGRDEAAEYYFRYIDRVPGDDVAAVLAEQLEQETALWSGLSEERSLRQYEPGKWSLREVLGHVNDTERLFQFRTFWFARGFEAEPLPSFDQDVSAASANAHARTIADLFEEFRSTRLSSLALVRSVMPEAWSRRGTASGQPFTARAAAFTLAGHAAHHFAIVRERYL